MTFGQKLKHYREMHSLTQEELAGILKTSKQVISRYEKDQRSPKVSIASQYAEKLGLSEQYLMNNGIETPAATRPEKKTIDLTPHETTVIHAYRAQPDMQPAVDKLLGVAEEPQAEKPHRIRLVASDGGSITHTMTQEQHEAAEAALDEADAKPHRWK